MLTVDLAASVSSLLSAVHGDVGDVELICTRRTPAHAHVHAVLGVLFPMLIGTTVRIRDSAAIAHLRAICANSYKRGCRLTWADACLPAVRAELAAWRTSEWDLLYHSLLWRVYALALAEEAYVAGNTEMAPLEWFQTQSCLAQHKPPEPWIETRVLVCLHRGNRVMCELVMPRARGAMLGSLVTSVDARLFLTGSRLGALSQVRVAGETLDKYRTLEEYGIDDEAPVEIVCFLNRFVT